LHNIAWIARGRELRAYDYVIGVTSLSQHAHASCEFSITRNL